VHRRIVDGSRCRGAAILPTMDYAESILDLIGNTPLVRLTHVTRDLSACR
jgi:hypothetical protein